MTKRRKVGARGYSLFSVYCVLRSSPPRLSRTTQRAVPSSLTSCSPPILKANDGIRLLLCSRYQKRREPANLTRPHSPPLPSYKAHVIPPIMAEPEQQGNSSPLNWWDELPRIFLNRSALKEIDRRNNAKGPPDWSGSQEKDYPIDLNRFARHGGPDLRHLRIVRLDDHAVQDSSR